MRHPQPECHPGKQPFDPETARYIYILIRTDLTLAQQAVQACHAGMQATAQFGGLAEDTRLALLSIPDAAALVEWQRRLSLRGIPHTTFFEPDHGIGESAIATPPISRREGKLLSRLPLWQPLPCMRTNGHGGDMMEQEAIAVDP